MLLPSEFGHMIILWPATFAKYDLLLFNTEVRTVMPKYPMYTTNGIFFSVHMTWIDANIASSPLSQNRASFTVWTQSEIAHPLGVGLKQKYHVGFFFLFQLAKALLLSRHPYNLLLVLLTLLTYFNLSSSFSFSILPFNLSFWLRLIISRDLPDLVSCD